MLCLWQFNGQALVFYPAIDDLSACYKPVILVATPAFGTWSVVAWQMVLWLGVMSTAFAFSIRYFLIARAGASFTSYVGYLIPAFAVMIGAIWLGESVTIEKLLALCLILVGLVFAQKPASGQKNQS